MRDFDKDRRTLQDRKDGYVTDEVLLNYADEGWGAALEEIERLDERIKELETLLNDGEGKK